MLISSSIPYTAKEIMVTTMPKALSYHEIAQIVDYQDWLEPVSFSSVGNYAQVLDDQTIPPTLTKLAKSLTLAGTKTLDYTVATIISLIGNYLTQFFRIIADEKSTVPYSSNIWSMLLGDSGAGKTPSMQSVIKAADSLFIEEGSNQERHNAIAKSVKEQSIRQHLSRIVKGEETSDVSLDVFENGLDCNLSKVLGAQLASKSGMLRTTDSSLAGLYDLLGKGLPVTFVADEFNSLLDEVSKNLKLRAALLNTASGFSDQNISRANQRSKSISNPTVVIIAGIQPDVLAPAITRAQAGDESNDGLINRFQISVLNVSDHEENKVEGGFSELAPFNGQLFFESLIDSYSLLQNEEQKGLRNVKFSKGAQAVYINWTKYQKTLLEQNKANRLLKSQISKYPMTICGLSLIYEVIKNYDVDQQIFLAVDEISEESFIYATKTINYLFSHAKTIFGDNGTAVHERASFLLRKLQNIGLDKPMSASEMAQRGWKGNKERLSLNIEQSLQYLLRLGYVRPVKIGKKILWQLNPMAQFI